jgi:hypothetical protein
LSFVKNVSSLIKVYRISRPYCAASLGRLSGENTMRPTHPSHIVLVAAGLLSIAGCSKQASEESAATESTHTQMDIAPEQKREAAADAAVAAPAAEAAPGLTTTAAPGVAFAYRYAFTLPAKAISSVQQQHASACERLGPTRCQITGMNYNQPREGEVSARLDLLLAPEIAQRFGSEGIAAVEAADGSLDNATINGDDAGGAIEQSQQQSAGLKAELARIERRLISKGLAQDERIELTRRADELRGQLRQEQVLRADKEASLATTPMSFAYGSEGLFAANGDPFGKAAANSASSVKALLGFVLTFAGLALPWLLLAALIVMVVRFRAMKQRLAQMSAPPPAADPAAQ